MIVIETFEAVSEIDGASMWFTPDLQLFVALDEPGDAVRFILANDSFMVLRETISSHCRPYRSSLAASQ